MSKVIKYANLASGDVIPFSIESDYYVDQDSNIEELTRMIDLNYITPSFRIYVLYPDETINFEIPKEIIKAGGSYNENYQNGQRRTLSFTVYNYNGDYTPTINMLWAGTRLRLDIGIEYNGTRVWFEKGYFVISKTTPSLTNNGQEVAITANDKFSLFENSTGRLENTFEIPEGQNISDIIKEIQQLELGDGSIFDPKGLIISEKLKGKRTQVTITKNAGDTYGSILNELATQLSAEIFYNANGVLTLVPITEVTQDKEKAIIYSFNADMGDMSQLNFDYDYNQIVNRIVVVGNSKNGGVYKATAINNDTRSPLCYQRIGYRTGNIINDSNIYSDLLAEERAEYELRQKLILKTTTTASILFNPFLSINNLITIDSEFFDLKHDKFLLQSISFAIDFSGQMNITFSNILNLSTDIEVISGITPRKVPDVDMSGLMYPLSAYTRNKKFYNGQLYYSIGESHITDVTQDTEFRELIPISGDLLPYDTLCFIYAPVDDRYFCPPNGFENYWHDIGVREENIYIRYYWIDLRGYYQSREYVDINNGGLHINDPSGSGNGIMIDYVYAINDTGEFRFDNTSGRTSILLYRIGETGTINEWPITSGINSIDGFKTQDKIYYTPFEYDSGLTVGKNFSTTRLDSLPYAAVTTWSSEYSAIEVVRDAYRKTVDGSLNNLTGLYQNQKANVTINFGNTNQGFTFSIHYYAVANDGSIEIIDIAQEPIPSDGKYILQNVYNNLKYTDANVFGVLHIEAPDHRWEEVTYISMTADAIEGGFPIRYTSPYSFNETYKNPIEYSTTMLTVEPRNLRGITVGVGVGVESVTIRYCNGDTGQYVNETITQDRTRIIVPVNTYITYYATPEYGYACPINEDNPYTFVVSDSTVTILPESYGWHKVASCDISMRLREEYDLSSIYGVNKDARTILKGNFYCKAKEDSKTASSEGVTEIKTYPHVINNTINDSSGPEGENIDSSITFQATCTQTVRGRGEVTTPYTSKLGATSNTTLICQSYRVVGYYAEPIVCYVVADIYQVRTKYEQR